MESKTKQGGLEDDGFAAASTAYEESETASVAIWCQRASAALEGGAVEQAIGHYRRALELAPARADVWNWLGLTLAQASDVSGAADAFRRAIETRPRFAQAWQNLGVALGHQGDYAGAIKAFHSALMVDPDYYEARLNLASTLATQKNQADAIAAYEDALQIRPESVEALNGIGLALASSGRNLEAVARLHHALRLAPGAIAPRNNLAAALSDAGDYEAAEEQFAELLRLKPDHVDTFVNRGNMLKEQGRVQEAIASYGEALRREPNNHSATWNRSLAWLQCGDFAAGWAAYESRLEKREPSDRPCPETIPWRGEPLDGLAVMLQAEQGLGDTIQFVRYAAALKDRGASRVILHCPAPLVEIMKACPLLDEVVVEGAPLPAFSTWAHLMSLPYRFGTTLKTVPAPVPYLLPDARRVEAWRERIGVTTAVKIGIAWQGNPHHRWDCHRSVPLAAFASLAALPGVRLYSLQRGPGVEQLNRGDVAVTALLDPATPDPDAVADQLALLACMDLVVSVDTMTAHLAGAAGIKTWLALSTMVDWRWLQETETSPWYPTMRLFRQQRRGEWKSVFDALAAATVDEFPVAASAPDVRQGVHPTDPTPSLTKEHKAGTDRVLLSLCMIVRDAASTLRECLKSIKPWIDEMIVVDTGSTDDTAAIAESLGANVFHFPWTDSFADARNESLRHATGAWIFWMDSDDTIDAYEGARLRGLVEKSTANVSAYVMQVHCPDTLKPGADVTVVDHVKLFRNLPGVGFEGRIHEQVLPSIRRQGGTVEWTDVHVVHSGADRSAAGRHKKQTRDLRLLRLDIEDRPGNSFVLFNYGMTLADAGQYAEAVEQLRKSVRLGVPAESHLRKAYALLAGALASAGRAAEALETCCQGLVMFADDVELSFRAGMLAHEAGHLDEALAHYRRVLRGPSGRRFASIDRSLSGYKAYYNMAAVLLDLGRPCEAEMAYREVVRLAPGWLPGLDALGTSVLTRPADRTPLPALEMARAGEGAA